MSRPAGVLHGGMSDEPASDEPAPGPRASDEPAPEAGRATHDGRPHRAGVAHPRPVPDLFVFWVAFFVVLMGACGVVFNTNPVHSALSLVLTLFGVAVLFVLQGANFWRRCR